MENDSSLLDAAREMDQDALVKIFDLYSLPLFNYAARLCGDFEINAILHLLTSQSCS